LVLSIFSATLFAAPLVVAPTGNEVEALFTDVQAVALQDTESQKIEGEGPATGYFAAGDVAAAFPGYLTNYLSSVGVNTKYPGVAIFIGITSAGVVLMAFGIGLATPLP
jgi:hypothetical protein